jgi:hypothetical protein
MRLVVRLLVVCSFVSSSTYAGSIALVDAYVENDVRLFSGVSDSDRHYTQGLHFRVGFAEGDLPRFLAAPRRPSWIGKLCDQRNCATGFTFGQSIYTPQNIRSPLLPPRDRSYAAWLYGGFLLQAREPGVALHTFEADIGVVGPHAYGEQIQTWWHNEIVHVKPPLGWEHQIRDEPALMLRYMQQRRLTERTSDNGRRVLDILLRGGGSVGNVFTLASVGPAFRFGYNINDQFGERPLTVAGPPAVAPRTQRIVAYAFVGADGRFVFHNIFLDGNCCRSDAASHRVEKRRFVGDAEGGIVIGYEPFRLTWRQVRRSREFARQQRGDIFGSIEFTYSRSL